MARKDAQYVDEQTGEITPYVEPSQDMVARDDLFTDFQTVEFDANQEPADLSKYMEEVGLTGEKISAKDLIGQTFTIYRMRAFRSSYDPTKHAWFCVIKTDPSGPFYRVVLGGQSVVELLDLYAGQGVARPLQVKLGYVEGGAFGGYFVFE